MNAVRRAIHAVVPQEVLSLLTWQEAEKLVCGTPTVDVDLLQRHTEYSAGMSTETPVVQYFWAVLRSWENEQRRRFIKFAWGQDRIPSSEREWAECGQRLKISPMVVNKSAAGGRSRSGRGGGRRSGSGGSSGGDDADKWLPRAEVCFFNLSLPPYSSQKVLNDQLSKAIEWGESGLDGDD